MKKSGTITATLVDAMKRAARRESRATSLTYSQALELEALRAGFSNWHAVTESRRSGVSVAVSDQLEIDPILPQDFYNTPNEERSEDEITRWWHKPFARTNPDGTFDVCCLDGGAWDRPTSYGRAEGLDAARELAAKKLGIWRWHQLQPVTTLLSDRVLMVIMPSRPGMEPVTVAELDRGSLAGASDWLEQWVKRHPPP